MTLREAAQQALEALKPPAGGRDLNQLALAAYDVEQMLRAALAEPVQPVMDRDTVIRLAREAGFDVEAVEGTDEVLERESDYYTRHPDIGYMVQTHTVERFAALVAAHEREECAKVAETAEPYQCADLIRSRT